MPEPTKRPNRPDASIRLLGQVVLTFILWTSTAIAIKADWFAKATNLPARVAIVAIGLGGFLPVVFVCAKAIRMEDEFTNRLHLIALAIAFAVVGTISYSVDLLHQASFIRQPSSFGLWALMGVVWWLCIVIVPRFYR